MQTKYKFKAKTHFDVLGYLCKKLQVIQYTEN